MKTPATAQDRSSSAAAAKTSTLSWTPAAAPLDGDLPVATRMDVLVTDYATDNGLVTEVLVSHVSKLGTRRIWWYYDLIAMKRSVCGREHGALDAVLFEDNAAWVRKHRSPLATQAHGMSATAA